MKKCTIILAMLLSTTILFGQYWIDTSFYSASLEQEKMVDIYIPPGYDENPDWQFPVIYYLHHYGGNQNAMNTMMTWLTSKINDGTIDPVIMVGADNSPLPFGGSCYLNSTLWGNYEDYMVNDLIEWIDASFRTIEDRNARGLLGQSMGGYGALRYGILHKDKFCVLAAHAGPNNFQDSFFREQMQISIRNENNPGPPFSYDFDAGTKTKLSFLMCGAASPQPDTNTLQPYVFPPIVEYMLDENGNYIDSILAKQDLMDNIYIIGTLTPSDSLGILLGCGSEDSFFLYDGHLALVDSLEFHNIPYEFYSHDGGHNMPGEFKSRALTFIDSLLINPGPLSNINPLRKNNIKILSIYPNPFTDQISIQFEQQEKAFTEIGIWNHLGQKISVICDGIKQAGSHQYTFDASGLPAGVYFCKLKLGNDAVMKKIIKL